MYITHDSAQWFMLITASHSYSFSFIKTTYPNQHSLHHTKAHTETHSHGRLLVHLKKGQIIVYLMTDILYNSLPINEDLSYQALHS